jgi:multicomponent K+:H+ antiporter subunit E
MRRLVPYPLRSAALLACWLALSQSLHPAHWVLGAIIGLVLAPALAALTPRVTTLRRAGLALRLFGVFLADIVVANLDVARRILGPESAIHPRFVWVPLAIRNPQGIAVFASMITMTPGTLSVDLSPDRRWLLVHAFNVDDEAALIAEVQRRYERPLMEIFT